MASAQRTAGRAREAADGADRFGCTGISTTRADLGGRVEEGRLYRFLLRRAAEERGASAGLPRNLRGPALRAAEGRAGGARKGRRRPRLPRDARAGRGPSPANQGRPR